MRAVPGIVAAVAVWAGLISAARAAEGEVIFDMETARHKAGEITKEKQKVPAGTVEVVDGKVGKAVKFTFVDGARGGFATAGVKGGPAWDAAGGFSFWVKGDGSSAFGGIEVIDQSDYKLRYGYCFPIESTEWTKVVVPWADLVPELAGPLVEAKEGYKPSGFGNFWFGKWFYWRDYPAHSFSIDQVALEPAVEVAHAPAPAGGALARVRAKIREKKPLTIVTMGDSLSDKNHWANKQVLWSTLLAQELKEKHGVEAKIVNPAIGGTTLSQNLILMPRWLKETPSPDLVIVWFGFNDWDSGVRGERFGQYAALAVDRIRRMTHGSADVLLLTTCPAHARWETGRELEEATKAVAAAKKAGLGDVAAEFRKAGTPDAAMKQTYWASDKVHLGAKGHATAKDVVVQALTGAGE